MVNTLSKIDYIPALNLINFLLLQLGPEYLFCATKWNDIKGSCAEGAERNQVLPMGLFLSHSPGLLLLHTARAVEDTDQQRWPVHRRLGFSCHWIQESRLQEGEEGLHELSGQEHRPVCRWSTSPWGPAHTGKADATSRLLVPMLWQISGELSRDHVLFCQGVFHRQLSTADMDNRPFSRPEFCHFWL